jgi:hypothetical protein
MHKDSFIYKPLGTPLIQIGRKPLVFVTTSMRYTRCPGARNGRNDDLTE